MVSYFIGYNVTYKDYMVYLPTQWKTTMSQYVKFDEDVWSSRSLISPSVIEGSDKVDVLESN